MEVKKNKSEVVIGLLLGVVITLLVFVILLATDMVSFSKKGPDEPTPVPNETKTEENNGTTSEETKETTPEKETVIKTNGYTITYKNIKKTYLNSNGKVRIINRRNLPIVSNSENPSSATSIQNYLTNVSNEDWKSLIKNYDLEDLADQVQSEVGVTYKYRTLISNDKYITFEYVLSGNLGGVGWEGIEGYNFKVSDGSIIKFNNIVKNRSFKNYFYNYVVKEIKSKVDKSELMDSFDENGKTISWKEVVKNNMFKTGNWYFTNKGIKFTLEKYLIANGAAGPISVEIPFEKINSYLKDEYK